MATFHSDYNPSKIPLNAYNNNIVGIYPTYYVGVAESTFEKMDVVIGNYTFEVSPDPNGLFTFDLKEIAKLLINGNYFNDSIVPEISISSDSLVYKDSSLAIDVSVSFRIFHRTIATQQLFVEQENRNYRFIKAVSQQEDYRKNIVTSADVQLSLQLPFSEISNKTYHATYFEGFPFDIPIYSNIDRPLTILHKQTNQTLEIDVLFGVNRLFISDGDNNFSFQDHLTLYYGLNELEIKISDTEFVTLFLKKVEPDCQTYLKWFNNNGGWSYFGFKNPIESRDTDSLGLLNNDNFNIDSSQDLFHEIGKSSIDSLVCYGVGLEKFEKEIINTISDSPKVYMFIKDEFQPTSLSSWIPVSVASTNILLRDSTRKKYDVVIEVIKNKRNTLTL
ncbi:hypothetical protein N9H19_03720 [Flavobacteriales bacterium]|nr:hypothetical protein [Flavobacteriales bacterium]